MRLLPIILVALLLTACQQAGPTAPAATDAKADRSEPLRFFEPEFVALENQMLLSLADACQTRAAVVELFDRCLRDRVATAFDDSGEGRTECAFHRGFGDFVDCVAVGNTFIDVMRRMTDTSPLPAGFWKGGDAMVQTLSRSIASRGVANCRMQAAEPGPGLDRCVDRWFEDHLALASSFTQRCPSGEDQGRKACLVEAVMVRFMQDHVPRLSAIGV